MSAFKVGDRVAYSRTFLKNIVEHTGWMPFARGTITRIEEACDDFVLADIDWGGTGPADGSRVNVKNLVHEARIHLEPA